MHCDTFGTSGFMHCALQKKWMFDVDVVILVGLMFLVSHFSHRFAKLLGNNPVSILATLIHLSFTKILRTLIIISLTLIIQHTIELGVWLYVANLDFLVG